MRLLLGIMIAYMMIPLVHSQSNHIFSGGEVIIHGILDISSVKGVSWSSDRNIKPGYFSLIENASYTGYSDAANIDGYVKKYGNSPFLFPVGSGNKLRSIEISNISKSSDAYATAWIEGDPSTQIDPTTPNAGKHSVLAVSGTIVSVSTEGQWDWQVGEGGNLGLNTTGNGEGLVIRVSIPDMSTFAEASDLRLVGWNGYSWVDLSGKSTATGNLEDDILSGTMLPGISAIGIGKIAPSPLVKLESFVANSFNCSTIIKWTTSYEKSGIDFILEQSSDGILYHTIGTTPSSDTAKGNSYSKTIDPPYGRSFYRLKFQNTNGTYSYSQVVTTNNDCSESDYMWIYPNPVVSNNPLNLRFKTSRDGLASLIVQSDIGQQIIHKTIQFKNGINTTTIDIKNLTQGIYTLRLIDSKGNSIGTVKRFIKQ